MQPESYSGMVRVTAVAAGVVAAAQGRPTEEAEAEAITEHREQFRKTVLP